jgi:hypothetical protein
MSLAEVAGFAIHEAHGVMGEVMETEDALGSTL